MTKKKDVTHYMIGVDPDSNGSIVVLDATDLNTPKWVTAFRFPSFPRYGDNPVPFFMDVDAFLHLIARSGRKITVVIEEQGARPYQDANGTWTAGFNTGLIDAALKLSLYPASLPETTFVYVRPSKWKTVLGLLSKSTKRDAMKLCSSLFDKDENFTNSEWYGRITHGSSSRGFDSTAEAALIAVFQCFSLALDKKTDK